MSADNTILVLKTRRPSGGFEYRISLVAAAENIYPLEDETTEQLMARRWFTLTWFRKSRVYLRSKSARQAAWRLLQQMRRQSRIVEYGITKLDLANELGEAFPICSLESVEAWLKEREVFPFLRRKSSHYLPSRQVS